MNAIKSKVTRMVLSKKLELAMRHMRDDPTTGMHNVMALASTYFNSSFYDRNLLGKNAFSYMREYLQKPQSKWWKYARNLLQDTDLHVLKTFILNMAYEAGYRGNNLRHQLMVSQKCNIPWAILFDPTSMCNMNCTGCWATEYEHTMNLSNEDMNSLVRQGEAVGCHFYLLTGGEPLIRKNDIITLAKKHPTSEFHVFTNGTLITDAFCESAVTVGNLSFSLSVEGFEAANDERRGRGSFQRTMKAMEILRRHRLLFGISVCYTRLNYKDVTSDDFFDMVIRAGCKYACFFHYMPVGNDAATDLLLTPEERTYVYHRVREIRSEQCPKLFFTIDFQNDGELINGCIAGGRSYLHVNANGDIEPCVFIHYSDTNIHTGTLLQALQNPLCMAYHKCQPFNDNLLRPCPMLENPAILPKIIHESNAPSTDLQSPESLEHLCEKCQKYAKRWKSAAAVLWRDSGHETNHRSH
jgi:MoaA/NifB/PqqE/SkfB family radical SAM enzyme